MTMRLGIVSDLKRKGVKRLVIGKILVGLRGS
jgi:hypothetical protein